MSGALLIPLAVVAGPLAFWAAHEAADRLERAAPSLIRRGRAAATAAGVRLYTRQGLALALATIDAGTVETRAAPGA